MVNEKFQINFFTPSGDRAAVVAGAVVVVVILVVVVETSMVVVISSVVVLDSSVLAFAGSVMAVVKAGSTSIAPTVLSDSDNFALVDVSFFSGIFAGAYTETGAAIARVFDG